jgi:uncharacterized protein
MIKPRGPICNLACEYCYYLPKTRLYPNSNFRMSPRLLEDFTRQMFAAQPGLQADFTWQGGEPTLMGLDFFKEAVRLQKKYAPPGVRVTNALQTNGTKITPAWCRFFKENNFLIGLSLDGPPEIHGAFRYSVSGRQQFDSTMRAVRLLKGHGVDLNILSCVHKANQDHPLEVYRFLRDRVGAQFIQFIPIIQRELDPRGREMAAVTERSVKAEAYGQFLVSVFDEWVQNDVGKVFVQIFDVALGIYTGRPASLCVFAETCGRAMVLEHNGDLFACDHFVDPEHLLGNLAERPLNEMVDSDTQMSFGRAKLDKLPQVCLDCEVRFLCNGGCPRNRDEKGLNLLCEGYMSFFRHIDAPMRTMRELLSKQRPPSEIMCLHRYEAEG